MILSAYRFVFAFSEYDLLITTNFFSLRHNVENPCIIQVYELPQHIGTFVAKKISNALAKKFFVNSSFEMSSTSPISRCLCQLSSCLKSALCK